MEKEISQLYDQMFEKEAAVFAKGIAQEVMELLLKRIPDKAQAINAFRQIEKDQPFIHRAVGGLTGHQPFSPKRSPEELVELFLKGDIGKGQSNFLGPFLTGAGLGTLGVGGTAALLQRRKEQEAEEEQPGLYRNSLY